MWNPRGQQLSWLCGVKKRELMISRLGSRFSTASEVSNMKITPPQMNCLPGFKLLTSLLLLGFLGSAPAFAVLGGDASSVQADQVHFRATLKTTNVEAYTVHEMQVPGGPLVREYVSLDGRVFAVAWQGPAHPDLRQLFGTYFDQYQQAARQAHQPGRRALDIQQPGLIVQSGGHMRAFFGRAYIPDMVPAGVRTEDIR